MPGYGLSDGRPDLTFASIAERLVELLDHLNLEAVDLVGLSFGGMHALHTAINHGERVRSVTLAGTSPAFGLDGTDPTAWKAGRLHALDLGRTPAEMAPQVLDRLVAEPLSPDIRTDLIEAFARIPADGLRAAIECLPTHDVRDQLASLTMPALVVVGELDAETPPGYSKALAELLVDAELATLAGVGHLSPSEAPDAFNRLLDRFLTSLTSSNDCRPSPSPRPRRGHQ
jgi:pimeloyl-ACP methyl ester carboxylesterase